MKKPPPRSHETTKQLHDAVEAGESERVRELLDSGVSVNALTIHHVTPLMTAARRRNEPIAKLLIERGADVNAKDKRSAIWEGRQTPLHYAVRAGSLEIVRLLIESGADVDCINQSWRTPLQEAVTGGRRSIVRFLLESGANPNGPEKCDDPPIVSAARNHCDLVAEFLKRGADPNRFGGSGRTAIGCTLSLECLRQLIEAGADVNRPDGHGETPLQQHLAFDLILIQTLIEAGADVNAQTFGYTPLMIVMQNCPRYDVARILLEAGADPNIVGEHGTVLDIYEHLKTYNDAALRARIASLIERNGGTRAA